MAILPLLSSGTPDPKATQVVAGQVSIPVGGNPALIMLIGGAVSSQKSF